MTFTCGRNVSASYVVLSPLADVKNQSVSFTLLNGYASPFDIAIALSFSFVVS